MILLFRESFLAIAALVRNGDLETAVQLAITRHVDLVAIVQQAAPQAETPA